MLILHHIKIPIKYFCFLHDAPKYCTANYIEKQYFPLNFSKSYKNIVKNKCHKQLKRDIMYLRPTYCMYKKTLKMYEISSTIYSAFHDNFLDFV